MPLAKIVPAWEPYRPSNGTEGQLFMEAWCSNCAIDANHNCEILARSLAFDLNSPEYPKEWVRRANDDEWPGSARCTAFVPVNP